MTSLHLARSAISCALTEVQIAESKARCNGGPAEGLAVVREKLKDAFIEMHVLTMKGGGVAFSSPLLPPPVHPAAFLQ